MKILACLFDILSYKAIQYKLLLNNRWDKGVNNIVKLCIVSLNSATLYKYFLLKLLNLSVT